MLGFPRICAYIYGMVKKIKVMNKRIITLALAAGLLIAAYYGFIFSLKSFLWLVKADSTMVGLVIVISVVFYLAMVEIKKSLDL